MSGRVGYRNAPTGVYLTFMTLLKDPIDYAALRPRLLSAVDELAGVAAALDRAVTLYQEATTLAGELPGSDTDFADALERFVAATGTGILGAALLDLEHRIGVGLWSPRRAAEHR